MGKCQGGTRELTASPAAGLRQGAMMREQPDPRMLGILKREEGSCRQGQWARGVGMPGRGTKMSRGWRWVSEERSGGLVTKDGELC